MADPDDDKTVFDPKSSASSNHLDSSEDDNTLPVGTRLGEFELIELIGIGGFGVVYLAEDHSLGRKVALKEYMPTSLASRSQGPQVNVKSQRHAETFEAGRRSFVNEARLLAQFDHSALVKVYRFWEDNGTAYMVMPFYEGITLKTALERMDSPPDENWLKRMLAPVLEALAVIHAADVFHRDIAPDNIMLIGGERPLLLDFGAARRVISDMTQALTVILKPGYAPIEQYAEMPELKQGAWTDIYALAAVVYRAILGRTPPPSVGRMMNDTMQPLAELAAGRYSDAFLRAIDRALAVKPQDRPQSIEEFRILLGIDPAGLHSAVTQIFDPSASTRIVSASGKTVTEKTSAPQDKRRLPLIVGAGGLIVGLAVAGYFLLSPTDPGAPVALTDGASAPAVPAVPPALREFSEEERLEQARLEAALTPPPDAQVPDPTPVQPSPVEERPSPLASSETTASVQAPTPPPPRVEAAPPAISAQVTPPAQATTERVETVPSPLEPRLPDPLAELLSESLPSFSPVDELYRIYQNRTRTQGVSVAIDQTRVRIDQDRLSFRVYSNEAGYVYIMMVGTDVQHFYMLFPNDIDGDNRIQPGEQITLPRPGWAMVAGGPVGINRFLAIVSEHPRDFSQAGLIEVDPFAEFPIATAAELLSGHTGNQSPFLGRPVCPDAGTACSDAYGAALFTIEEIR